MSEQLGGWKRTGMCEDFSSRDIGKKVTLMGWVDSRRNLGGLIFVWLRDRSGIIQLVFDENDQTGDFSGAESLRAEFVIAVKGEVVARTPENVNPDLHTGEIEVKVEELKILSKAETPPFEIEENSNVREELRLKYRYLDLRRPDMQKNFILRNRIAMTVRKYLDENGFMEIETPMLQKSTPEGARDYLVPSRIHKGAFYALPQSPQIFKQLLMVSGFDRYYQLAKCFRDEDLRADRQPEFTQIDMELSFVEVEDIIAINEGLIQRVFHDVMGIDIKTPLRRIPWQEAMERYGSDKPDTRFGMELMDISDIAKGCSFKVFSGAVENGGSVRCINAKKAGLSRKEIDALGEFVKTYGAKGLAWMNFKEEGMASPIAKFLTEEEIAAITERTGAQTGDLLLFVADRNKVVFDSLGALRLHLAHKLGLIDENRFDLLWVTEFPQFEYSEEEGRYVAMHHPFTAPMDEDIEYLETQPEKVRAKAYDIVLNGNEIGGGSIRIHNAELQERMFRALGFSKEEAWNRFGFMMEAFKYGTPPHGGLAYGLDRLVMLLGKCQSIRDVIAFPKVQNASDLMSEAPSQVDEKQLEELGIGLLPQQ
ncbi:aspartate--tRNA ligase [Christensenellaceae bacterium NSJ-63]|uniref:Aspartate--tRNA ligase n=1 Tax=Guopingia tenuis TaxID=2763656 RepID=A0A926DH64_9FIRM|nr:aspartate--tRNA ligase [Guopingia tenuis]MBC8537699.1 aspartate--tRNA ligase [Guopingia tenuis]